MKGWIWCLVWFRSLTILSHISTPQSLLFTSPPHTDGRLYNHNNNRLTAAEGVNEGDLWEMEVDLRSEEKEKRTLHFFVRGKQQNEFIKGVPDRVEFGVWYFISYLYLYFYLVYLFISIQICTYFQNDGIEFKRLEELKEPRVKSIDGEEGYEW